MAKGFKSLGRRSFFTNSNCKTSVHPFYKNQNYQWIEINSKNKSKRHRKQKVSILSNENSIEVSRCLSVTFLRRTPVVTSKNSSRLWNPSSVPVRWHLLQWLTARAQIPHTTVGNQDGTVHQIMETEAKDGGIPNRTNGRKEDTHWIFILNYLMLQIVWRFSSN